MASLATLAPGLTFLPDTHTYIVAGVVLPSVCQVLEDNQLRMDTSAIAFGVLERARLRGVAVHAATHYDDEGTLDERTLDAEVAPFVEAWRTFKRERAIHILELERRYAHPVLAYGGTIDRIATARGHRLPIVIDLKTGDQTGVSYQLAAYGELYRAATGTPLVERWAVLLCPWRQVPYMVTEYPGTRDWRIFRAALELTYERAAMGRSWRRTAA
jgi:hypothetical protein